ncbi:hypothetical protein C2G38_2191778 [Gigaspora rosea]|uniref:Uncharacterized protein n=1 Tax=Gigaspora rosea TaxID=44941 RepID=A0A397UZP7_9GLOM|nr:hypothetical protein C2G38_2191778 [Gigaspora rosea]
MPNTITYNGRIDSEISVAYDQSKSQKVRQIQEVNTENGPGVANQKCKIKQRDFKIDSQLESDYYLSFLEYFKNVHREESEFLIKQYKNCVSSTKIKIGWDVISGNELKILSIKKLMNFKTKEKIRQEKLHFRDVKKNTLEIVIKQSWHSYLYTEPFEPVVHGTFGIDQPKPLEMFIIRKIEDRRFNTNF